MGYTYFTLAGGLWTTPLLSLLVMTVAGQDCSRGNEPVIDPPVLVAEYGGPATATCNINYTADNMGWEARTGAKTALNTQQLVWSVDNTGWLLNDGISCFANAGFQQCSTHLPIILYKIPKNVSLRHLSHIGPLLEGQQYSLQCEVQSVAPAQNLTIIWYRGDTELEHADFPQFTIEGDKAKDVNVKTKLGISASREDHGVSYSCAARLDLNTAKPIPVTRSNAVQLEVLYKPQIVSDIWDMVSVEGGTVEWNCTADAHPRPAYQWRHNNNTLENENNATLFIVPVQRDNAGVYQCIVSNSEGETSAEMTLDVWYKPRIVSSVQDAALTEGKTQELNCTADAHPRPMYQWRHNNKTLENEIRSTLLITSIQRPKAGIYECIVRNAAGETSAKMTLDVWYYPRILSPIQDVSLTEGESLQLNCTADAHPSPTYQWRHNNKTLASRNGSTLLVESTRRAGAGVYECIVSNIKGVVSATMRVDIWNKPSIVSSVQNVALTEGQTLELNCEARANPRPTYQWRHNDKTLENETKATLLIKSVQRAKAGTYKCIVSNPAGETSVEMRVDISAAGSNLPWIILIATAIVLLLAVITGICYRYQKKKKREGRCWLTKFTARTSHQSRPEIPLNGHPE